MVINGGRLGSNFLLKVSFFLFVIMVPIAIIFFAVRGLTPPEILHQKPENIVQVLVPALGAAVLLILTTTFAYVIWLLAMRMIFGSESVRSWLESKGTHGFGGFGRLIGRLTEWIL